MSDYKELVERLREVVAHDWRFSFLAHTSDTAADAAAALGAVERENWRLREERDSQQRLAIAAEARVKELEIEIAAAKLFGGGFFDTEKVSESIRDFYRVEAAALTTKDNENG